MAFRNSFRWSCQGPAESQGLSSRVERPVVQSRTCSTSFFCRDCFLKTSYRPRNRADKTVVQIHIGYRVCPPMNSRMMLVGGIAAISAGRMATTWERNVMSVRAFA